MSERKPPRRAQGLQALHVVAECIGASDEVINGIPDWWRPRAGLPPGGREQCRKGRRPCEYVQCNHNMWMRDGADRAGKPDNEPRSVLEMRTLTNCELDVREAARAANRELTAADIAKFFGVTRRRVQQIAKRALSKLEKKHPELRELLDELARR